MDFVNASGLPAGWTMGFEGDGREMLVVVAKQTFAIPPAGGEPEPAEAQVPLVEADEFTGQPGLSAVLRETDYAHRKPRCDVLLNGCAHAPSGRPAEAVNVGLKVGAMQKMFTVVGDRIWDYSGGRMAPTPPKPFLRLSISYDRAYGGADTDPQDPARVDTYVHNPIGVGHYPLSSGRYMAGKPLPNTAEAGKIVSERHGVFQPMSFGPVGRNFKCRYPLAGTYDQAWLDNRAPFWPDDFDYSYFQAAPPEQQIPYPQGGEEVVLANLTPEGLARFCLPAMDVPVLVIPHQGDAKEVSMLVDTVLVEPDERRLMMTARVLLPQSKSCFDLKQVIVGGRLRDWHRRRILDSKRLYHGFAELLRAAEAKGVRTRR